MFPARAPALPYESSVEDEDAYEFVFDFTSPGDLGIEFEPEASPPRVLALRPSCQAPAHHLRRGMPLLAIAHRPSKTSHAATGLTGAETLDILSKCERPVTLTFGSATPVEAGGGAEAEAAEAEAGAEAEGDVGGDEALARALRGELEGSSSDDSPFDRFTHARLQSPTVERARARAGMTMDAAVATLQQFGLTQHVRGLRLGLHTVAGRGPYQEDDIGQAMTWINENPDEVERAPEELPHSPPQPRGDYAPPRPHWMGGSGVERARARDGMTMDAAVATLQQFGLTQHVRGLRLGLHTVAGRGPYQEDDIGQAMTWINENPDEVERAPEELPHSPPQPHGDFMGGRDGLMAARYGGAHVAGEDFDDDGMEGGGRWQYEGDDGWHAFEASQQASLERMWARHADSQRPVRFFCPGGMYSVDIGRMTQTNQRTENERRVRRGDGSQRVEARGGARDMKVCGVAVLTGPRNKLARESLDQGDKLVLPHAGFIGKRIVQVRAFVFQSLLASIVPVHCRGRRPV